MTIRENNSIEQLAFSPNGQVLAAASDSAINLHTAFRESEMIELRKTANRAKPAGPRRDDRFAYADTGPERRGGNWRELTQLTGEVPTFSELRDATTNDARWRLVPTFRSIFVVDQNYSHLPSVRAYRASKANSAR